MTTGLVHGLAEDVYHGDMASLSHSGAKVLLQAPAVFRWRRNHPAPSSPAMELGTITHALALGTPQCWRTIGGGRGVTERREATRAEGLIPTTLPDLAEAAGMAAAIQAHPEAAQLLDYCPGREVSAYAEDPSTGILMRCRVDALGDRLAVDVKTVREGALEDFGRQAFNLSYHMQAAWYMTVLEAAGHPVEEFAFLLVEKTPPYLVAVRLLDDAFLEMGRRKMRRALDLYAKCLATDEWPGYQPYAYVSAPRWAQED